MSRIESTDSIALGPGGDVWLVQFVMRRNDGGEDDMGRHLFDTEQEARDFYAQMVAEDRVSKWWRLELRHRVIPPWTVVESSGYQKAVEVSA